MYPNPKARPPTAKRYMDTFVGLGNMWKRVARTDAKLIEHDRITYKERRPEEGGWKRMGGEGRGGEGRGRGGEREGRGRGGEGRGGEGRGGEREGRGEGGEGRGGEGRGGEERGGEERGGEGRGGSEEEVYIHTAVTRTLLTRSSI